MIAFLVDWGCETYGPRRAVVLVDDAEPLCSLYDTVDDVGSIDSVKFRQLEAGVYLEISECSYDELYSFKPKTKWRKLADVYIPPWRR